MARRGRKPPVTTAAPIQAGPPQAMPQAGEFPASPIGVQPQSVGNTPPAPGMHKPKVSKSKGKGRHSK